jgi:hypothetical protein
LKIDAFAPTAQVTSPADGASLLSGDVNVKVDAADAGSGITDVELYVDGDWTDYSRSKTSPYEFTLPAGTLALGTHRLKVNVTDALGNHTSSAPVTITLKDGLPNTTIACDGAACPAGFVKGPVSVALSATDGGGGLGATRYTLDGSDPSDSSPEYAGPLTLTETTTVKFRTWDTGGNAEAVKTQVLKLDAVAPTAQITSPADGASLLSGDVNVKVDASDAGSGISDVELYVDGDWADYSRSKASPYEFTLPAGTLSLGTHRLKVNVTDALGNHTSSAPVTITLKNGLATTSISCDGNACPTGFVKGPVSVALSATDGGGGLGATRYTLDGSDPTDSSPEYSGAFTVTETTTVKSRSWDSAGNAGPIGTETLKIDATAPTAAISSPTDGSSQLMGDVTVKVDAADSGSGVSDVELFADGDYAGYSKSKSSPYEITLPVGTLALGTHKLKANVTDNLGQRTSSPTITITLKNGLTTTTMACDGASCPSGFVKGPVTATLAAIDGGAGVGATRYTLDGTDPSDTSPQYGGPFTITDTTTVKFRSWDSAGNAEPVQSQTIKIDTTAPTAQIVSPLADDAVEGDVTVKVDAADSGAGLSDVDLLVDGDYIDTSKSTTSPYEITWHAGSFAPGSHKLKAIAVDSLGNRTSSTPVTVTIKAPPAPPGPPITTVSCDGLACPLGFIVGPVNVTLAAIDGGAGIGATRFTLDGTDPSETSTEYTGSFPVTETTTVKFRSWDSAGNAEAVRTQAIRIDTTAPTAQITSPVEGDSLTGDVTVKVDAADSESGVATVDLYVDGDYVDFSKSKSSPYEITLPAGTLAPGTHKLKVNVTDSVGNVLHSQPVTITVAG